MHSAVELGDVSYQSARASRMEGFSRTDEQTSTDGTTCITISLDLPSWDTCSGALTDSNHLHMAAHEASLQRVGLSQGRALIGRGAIRLGGLLLDGSRGLILYIMLLCSSHLG